MSTNDVSKPFIMKLDDDTEAYRIIRPKKNQRSQSQFN